MTLKGRVMRSTGSWYEVAAEDGVEYQCRMRGKIRLDGIKETNPIAVGDYVLFEVDHGTGAITKIVDRKNHILRQSVKKTGHSHVLAANVDQVMLMATLVQPRTSLGFIDRFLATAESFRIPQLLLFNKNDLLNTETREQQQQLADLYDAIGVTTIQLCALQDDLTDLRRLLANKVTLIAGHSGVGKSTVLNRLSPAIQQKIGEISDFSEKGKHTTTFAEMFQLDAHTFIIDTPGIKEWGLVDMTQQEISDYFPDMREVRLDCKFGARCIHINEPGCAVIKGVQEGKISISRYDSYLSMVMGEDNRK